jgi:hypothetical protein
MQSSIDRYQGLEQSGAGRFPWEGEVCVCVCVRMCAYMCGVGKGG